MASVFRIFIPDFEPSATFENVGAPPVDSPVIEDPEQFDREIEATFDKAEKRLAAAENGAVADAAES